jgi:hypothetical protein
MNNEELLLRIYQIDAEISMILKKASKLSVKMYILEKEKKELVKQKDTKC